MEGVNDVTPTDQDWLVDFRGVELRRGGKTLVGPVDWQVELDERWVIIGPNGAGKTTILRMIAGFVRPTAGAIRLDGTVISSPAASFAKSYSPAISMIGWSRRKM